MKHCSFFSWTVYCTWDSFSFRGVKKLNFIWRKKMTPSLLLLYHLSSCLVFLGNSVQQMNAFIRKFSKLIQFCIAIYYSSANTRPLHCFLWLKSLYAPILFPVFLFLLQFPGCIAEIQIYIILIGRNLIEEQLV